MLRAMQAALRQGLEAVQLRRRVERLAPEAAEALHQRGRVGRVLGHRGRVHLGGVHLQGDGGQVGAGLGQQVGRPAAATPSARERRGRGAAARHTDDPRAEPQLGSLPPGAPDQLGGGVRHLHDRVRPPGRTGRLVSGLAHLPQPVRAEHPVLAHVHPDQPVVRVERHDHEAVGPFLAVRAEPVRVLRASPLEHPPVERLRRAVVVQRGQVRAALGDHGDAGRLPELDPRQVTAQLGEVDHARVIHELHLVPGHGVGLRRGGARDPRRDRQGDDGGGRRRSGEGGGGQGDRGERAAGGAVRRTGHGGLLGGSAVPPSLGTAGRVARLSRWARRRAARRAGRHRARCRTPPPPARGPRPGRGPCRGPRRSPSR